jgi:hypothetical protein
MTTAPREVSVLPPVVHALQAWNASIVLFFPMVSVLQQARLL